MNVVNREMEFDLGYLSGAFSGKGHIIVNEKNGNYAIGMSGKNDFVNTVSSKLLSIIGKPIKVSETGDNASFNIYGKDAVLALLATIGPKGSNAWTAPSSATLDFKRGFLRGYFDGEAYVYSRIIRKTMHKPILRATSVNQTGMRGVQRMLEEEHVHSRLSVIKSNGSDYCRLEISGKVNLMLFLERIGLIESKKMKFKI